MNNRAAKHCWRSLAVGTVLLVMALHSQLASAQCAISYGDAYADDTNVWVWNGVTDYYNSYCYPGTYNFVHGYYANITLWSPSSIMTNGSNSSVAYGGGGSTEAWAVLAIQDEAGLWTYSGSVSIFCSILGGYIYTAAGGGTVQVPPTITAINSPPLWYFGGNLTDGFITPDGYTTQLVLQASGASIPEWRVISDPGVVHLTSPSQAQPHQTTVTSLGSLFSNMVGDVQIVAKVDGIDSAPFSLTSRTPNRFDPRGSVPVCPESGFELVNYLYYNILDNLDAPIPIVVLGNEKWTTGVQDESPAVANNWRRGSDGPATSVVDPATGIFSLIYDRVGTEALHQPGGAATFPVPDCSGAGTNVHHWGQSWYIGSTSSGVGRRVQTDTIQKKTNTAIHTGITSPVP